MSLFRPIHHTFGPLADSRQCMQALGLLFQPWAWKRGGSTAKLREALQSKFSADAYLFGSGREALMCMLRSMELKSGDEVIVQGYTCVVVPNAIHAAGGKTVYADIDRDTLNLDISEVERSITPRTRAIICQHTFGIPSGTEALRALCDKHKLLLIEDCAHVMPDSSGPRSIGHFGDAMLFSFGRDKAISGVSGGAILCRKQELSAKLKQEEERAADLGLITIKKLLLYPLIYGIARPFYGLFIGKAFLKLCNLTGLLVPITDEGEKQGEMSKAAHRMPNACAALALAQLKRLKVINDHRRLLTQTYLEAAHRMGWDERPGVLLRGIKADMPLQKFPIFTLNADLIRDRLKKHNVYLDDGWTGCIVCPPSVAAADANYEPGSDPVAEASCEKILSLPTHPGMSVREAEKLMAMIHPLSPA